MTINYILPFFLSVALGFCLGMIILIIIWFGLKHLSRNRTENEQNQPKPSKPCCANEVKMTNEIEIKANIDKHCFLVWHKNVCWVREINMKFFKEPCAMCPENLPLVKVLAEEWKI